MKFTKEQKQAIKRICEDYDFEDIKELKREMKEMTGDILDEYYFNSSNEEQCYKELERAITLNN